MKVYVFALTLIEVFTLNALDMKNNQWWFAKGSISYTWDLSTLSLFFWGYDLINHRWFSFMSLGPWICERLKSE